MRQIKFRGKNIVTNEWVYGYYGEKLNVQTGENDSYIITPTYTATTDSSYFVDVQVNPNTVGQYTGSKEKSSKGIYEGDILDIGDFNVEVFWDNITASWFVRGGFLTGDGLSHYAETGEIVGNIYDNPKLLENL